MKKFLILFLMVTLIGQPMSLVLAQSQGEIRINQLSTIEGPDAMTLRLYFNIYDDRTGAPMLVVDAQSAQITLLNTDYTVDGELKKPDVPIYITLVLDSSGSMGGAAKDLQNAAKLALNNTPDNSLFSVVQFDEEIQLLQDFTENIPALQFAIDRYKVSRNGTCLYDATYSAVEAMAKAPAGRRAVILFTDGKDENKEGQPCSKHTYQELVDLAMKSQVPISTIGLSYNQGAINSLELESMAGSTGGVSAIATQGDLAGSFEKIMQALKAQWMLEAAIYPRRGNNDAVFNLTLKDGLSLNTAFNINSNTDYPGPPSPVTAGLAGLLLNAARQSYEVQLDLTSSELVGYIKIEVWDGDAGSKVGEYTFDQPGPNNSFFVPTENLTIGRSYQLRVSAVAEADQIPFEIVRDDQGKGSTQLIHEFEFDPSSSYPSLQIQSLQQDGGDLVLTVNVTNPDLIGGFDGWLVDEETNTQVPNSNFTAPAITSTNGTIIVPTRANHTPDGKYTLVVRVLAKNNNVYSTAIYEEVSYEAPSIFQRLGVALIAAPIFLAGILLVIAVVVGFLMYNSTRQKSLSGTPVLQGRLGGKMDKRGKQAGPVIPVADEEPIPSRSRPPVSQSAATQVSSAPIPSKPVSADATMVAGDVELDGSAKTVIASAPLIPTGKLIVVQAGVKVAPSEVVTLKNFPFVIGRTEGSLTIADQNVSRRHAQITFDGMTNVFYLTDLKSSNGTRLNNERIIPGQPVKLNNGATIGLGPGVSLRFEIL